MLNTVNSLMNTYNVSRKVAVIVYRFVGGIDTLADVTMTLVRKNPISGEYETSMTEWFQFCEVCKGEGFDVPDKPERKIRKDGKYFVFAS